MCSAIHITNSRDPEIQGTHGRETHSHPFPVGCAGLLPGEREASGRSGDQDTDTCVDEFVVSADRAQWGSLPHYECNAQFGARGALRAARLREPQVS